MANSLNALNDAMHRYFAAKMPFNSIAFANSNQTLLNNSAWATTETLISNFSGNPTQTLIYVKVSAATTVTVTVSPDGVNYYSVGGSGQAFTAAGSAVFSVLGSAYVALTTSAAVTATVTIVPIY